MTKTCTKCGSEKPLDAFSRCSAARSGLHWWCRECFKNHRPQGCRICGGPKPAGRGVSYCSDACRLEGKRGSWRRFKAKRDARIAEVKEAKGCMRCGFRDARALDFHHRDPKTKEFTITRLFVTRERELAEIAKCDVLCSNCHRILHMESHA